MSREPVEKCQERRTTGEGEKPDPLWSNLREVDLREVDLRWANLSNADLGGLDLNRIDLTGAKLDGADLSRADLGGANLREANLDGADLRNSKLVEADLRLAYLGGADLNGADLRWADLPNNFVDLGCRKDGWTHHATCYDGELMFCFGCRYFSLQEARSWWSNHDRGEGCLLCAESLIKIETAVKIFVARGLYAEDSEDD